MQVKLHDKENDCTLIFDSTEDCNTYVEMEKAIKNPDPLGGNIDEWNELKFKRITKSIGKRKK